MKKISRIILFNIVIILGLITAVEVGARIFLYFTRGSSTIGLPEQRQHLYYKPFVMFGPEWDEELASSKYSKIDAHEKLYRILLLGGSAAAGFPEDILEDAFQEKFPAYRFEVISASHGGYVARQELIIAALWGPTLNPDMIISLDGANDLIHRLRIRRAGTFYLNHVYELAISRPFLSPFVDLLRRSQFVHGITRLKQRTKIGPASQYLDAIPVYISAQHGINLLAKGMPASRIVVLQPFLSFKVPQSKAEAGFTHYEYRESVIKEMYGRLHKELKALAGRDNVIYIDSRDAFNGMKKTIFSDDLHFVSKEGYQILAKYIVSSLKDDDL